MSYSSGPRVRRRGGRPNRQGRGPPPVGGARHRTKPVLPSLAIDDDKDLLLHSGDSSENERETDQEEALKQEKPRRTRLKVTMQVLHMSEISQNLAEKALTELRGSEYKMRKKERYKASSEKSLNSRFWVKDNELIVKGLMNGVKEEEKVEGLNKLTSYGFHHERAIRALKESPNDIGYALETLAADCFGIKYDRCNTVDDSLLAEQKEDERIALESIYNESEFKVKVPGKIWEIKCNLPFLHKYLPSPPSNLQKEPYKDLFNDHKICGFYLRGFCRNGTSCRKQHIKKNKTVQVEDGHLKIAEEDKNFYLEIRFSSKCRYPKDSPLVLLSSRMKVFPPELCLKISCRLMKEATEHLAGSPVVFSLVGLLSDAKEMNDVIAGPDSSFSLNPKFNEREVKIDQKLSLAEEFVEKDWKKKENFGTNRLSVNSRIRQRYQQNPIDKNHPMLRHRRQLPAWKEKDRILATLKNHQIIVVSGMTGCGKSTQVPQFILDEWLAGTDETHCNIIVTQPRRLSAIGVAERVADERNEKIGNTVGYSIRLESKSSVKTRLLFCTTGVLLRKLERETELESVTHVIVDEVHERSEECDFLLMILKNILVKRKDLKIILMSATLNADIFAKYFNTSHYPPVIDIPGRTYPVKQFFLEEIIEMSSYTLEHGSTYSRRDNPKSSNLFNSSKIKANMLNELADDYKEIPIPKTSKIDETLASPSVYSRYKDLGLRDNTCETLSIMDFNRINFDLIERLLESLTSSKEEFPSEGSILIFLPGMMEILTLHSQLLCHKDFGSRSGKFKLFPLHGSLSSEDQAAIFAKTPNGVRKIIISTNIAETSVTIDDCIFVIDSGKMKENRFDPLKNMESLETTWVSKANVLQRKGRAGRVMPGYCFHLYTKFRFDYHFHNDPIPEIKRVPLEKMILRVKSLPCFGNESLSSVLKNLIEPPSKDDSNSAKERLFSVSALDIDENLTALGYYLASLPVDVKIGKLLIYGALFQCLDSALTIAAILSYRSPFSTSFGKRDEINKKRKEFVNSYVKSDQLTDMAAYNKWREVTVSTGEKGSYFFAQENLLSFKTLQTLVSMKHQFVESLAEIGFLPDKIHMKRLESLSKLKGGADVVVESTGSDINANCSNERIILSILCGALYPNVVQILSPETKFKQTAGGAVHKPHSADEVKFKTKDDGYVFVHPSSAIYGTGEFSGSSYLMYHAKIKTSKIFIRSLSIIPMYTMILFGKNDLNVESVGGKFVISMEGGWVKFVTASQTIAELLRDMRYELNKLLDDKIKNPSMNLIKDPRGNLIISTIVNIISKE